MYEDLADFSLKYLQDKGAKYAEVRLEESKSNDFVLKNGNLEVASFNEITGIGIRFTVNDTLGFLNINLLEKEKIKTIIEKAIKVTKNSSKIGEKTKFSEEKAHTAKYSIKQKKSVDESPDSKLKEIFEIDKIIKNVDNRFISVDDSLVKKYYINSDGSRIISEIPRTSLFYFLTILHNKKSIQRHFMYGSTKGYECLKEWNIHENLAEEVKALTNNLKNGISIKPGTMDLVTAPEVTGIAVHESCGHPLEADRILGREGAQAGESFVKKDMIGEKIGSDAINIYDDPTMEESYGFYLYDDEGVKARKKYLQKKGVITEFLQNRQTAVEFNIKSNGSARASAFDREPLIRMSNTLVEPGNFSENEIFEGIKKGIYLKSFMEWNIDDKRWQQKYVGNEAYLIENGKITKPVIAPVLEITTPALWSSVDALSKKMEFFAGPCGKGEPMSPIAVYMGGPHMRLRDVYIR